MSKAGPAPIRAICQAGAVCCLWLSCIGAGPETLESKDDAQEFEAIRRGDLIVAGIGWRLASANASLCDRLEPGTGMQLHTLDQFDTADRAKAHKHFGFATEIAIEGIVPGSPAERAGLRQDDSLVRIGAVTVASIPGKPVTTDRLVAAQLAIAALPPESPIEVEVLRAGVTVQATVQPVPACKSRFEMQSGDVAGADGEMVRIGSKFVEDYPEDQIAAMLAHEFSHNILRHRDRLQARGVSYGLLSGLGGNTKYFRQTELQADLLSVYLLNNAGYSMRASIAFWRRFGPSGLGGIFRSRSHPDWRDRVATLEREIARIEPISRRPIIPELVSERDSPLDGNWEALTVRHR
ncbi:MAG: peptidase M48 family protein [Alphaproteobacteria bacterium]|nr:MAG: peptidase M48 family protein [Alphaproteobacteria bacterium]